MIPERIGKYAIRRKLGKGATSTVYLGYDPFAHREVAIKVILADTLADHDRGQLYRHLLVNEASLAGKLVHPHIVQIYDAVLADDLSYIVMEYVAGGTLDPYCSPVCLLPLERLVEIVFKCTRALDYAHHMGVTHRDIKPANILLSAAEGGVPKADIKISDFGASIQATDQTRTQVSGIGSPAYMSPQQVREMPLNHQTDIYSLGVVMYQLLTGRLPFQADNSYGMVYQICHADVPPPSLFRTDLPTGLEAVVARAMARDVEARYATWEEFSHDLAQIFRNQQLTIRPEEFPDSEKFEALRAFPFFAEFSDAEIWEVVRFSRWEKVAADTVIMKDGEPGDFFCFVIEGEARVIKRSRTLSLLTAGECFGEMAVIGRGQHLRSADVVAQTMAKIMSVSGNALRGASDTCRMHFYQAFLGVLAGRLTTANARLAAI